MNPTRQAMQQYRQQARMQPPKMQPQQTPMPQGNLFKGAPQVAQQLNSPPPGQGQMQAAQQAAQQAMQNQGKMGNMPMSASPPMQTPTGMPQPAGAPPQGIAGLMGKPMGNPPMGAGAGFGPSSPPTSGGFNYNLMMGTPATPQSPMKKGGKVQAYAKGGAVSSKPKASSASSRGDGIAQRGKTKGRMC